MEKEQFIQLLGNQKGVYNIGLILYKKEKDLEEINDLFPDSNQISTFSISLEFDDPKMASIFNELQKDRIVKIFVEKRINSDFFMFINFLSKFGYLKWNQKQKEPHMKSKIVICMKKDDYYNSKYELNSIFYPILNLNK